MTTIQDKDKVGISFVGKLDSGDIFTTAEKDEPLFITVGDSEAPPTLELALNGMKLGETKTVRVPPEESYGPRQKDLLQELGLDSFPESIEPKPGMTLALNVDKDGETHQVPATVIEIKDGIVTVDYNHPLAGHHLTYTFTIVSIENNS